MKDPKLSGQSRFPADFEPVTKGYRLGVKHRPNGVRLSVRTPLGRRDRRPKAFLVAGESGAVTEALRTNRPTYPFDGSPLAPGTYRVLVLYIDPDGVGDRLAFGRFTVEDQ